MGTLIRSTDWSKTALGPTDQWPSSVLTVVNLMLSSSYPISLLLGPELRQLYNDAYVPLLGTKKHPGILGRPIKDGWPEAWHVIGPYFQSVLDTGTAVGMEDLLVPMDRDGYMEETYFSFSFDPFRDDHRRVGGVFCACRDTTRQVLHERRLRVLREHATQTANARSVSAAIEASCRSLAENNPDLPFVLAYLPGADETFRLAASAGVPDAAAASLARVDGEGGPWPLARVIRTGEWLVNDLPRALENLPSDTFPPRGAVVVPVRRPGQLDPLACLVVGLNPRRALDDDYRNFLESVAGQVASSLVNARAYEEANAKAEALAELDRAKATFLGNVSHEFRTPLTLMLAPIQDMLGAPPGAVIDPVAVELLHRNALRLQKLVNTLLEFSRIEAGRVEALYEPVDLSALTAELASSFRAAIERAGLELVVDCPPLPEAVYVDRDMWEKIVLNLLSNAFKFTFEGSVTVRLRVATEGVRFEVADTGTGIADEALPRLFERFHRIEGARSRSHEGSGIGLALIQELVRQHGGSVEVTSRVGAGTTFSVLLPRGAAHPPEARVCAVRTLASTPLGAEAYVTEALRWALPAVDLRAAPPASTVSQSGEKASPERIVFADDNADMRDYVARLLGERWIVETVRDGVEALASVQRSPPALVVCDLMMPTLDGFGLIAAMRADAALRATPIIILSARAGEEEIAKGLSSGANDYIAKPFSARELLVRVASTLALARVAHETQALKDAQARHVAALFEHAPVAICVLRGPDHVFEVANPRYAALLPGRSLLNRPVREVMPEVAGQGIFELLDRVYETGEPHVGRSVRLMMAGEDGHPEEQFFDFAYEAIPGEDGKTESVLVVGYDVTDLARARRDAESANRTKEEFFAILGHELRNPLAPITTALQLMRLRGDSSLMKERNIIERQVAQITRLVDDLLDVSRITRGKVNLKRVPIELADVVAKGIEMASPLLEQRCQHLDVDVAAEGLPVYGDASRLAQVVSNLLTNAAKYTEPGGRVRVVAEKKSERVLLRVVDSGMGIAPEMLDRVFEPFAQEGQALDRAQGGLGLGLTVVANLVKLHDGTVTALSAGRGHGSTFTIDLPLSEIPAIAAQAAVPPESRRRGAGALRVLVVDDNSDAADTLADALAALGCDSRVAHDGAEAIRIAVEYEPQVALLDIGLPVMDGYELAARLREAPRRA